MTKCSFNILYYLFPKRLFFHCVKRRRDLNNSVEDIAIEIPVLTLYVAVLRKELKFQCLFHSSTWIMINNHCDWIAKKYISLFIEKRFFTSAC